MVAGSIPVTAFSLPCTIAVSDRTCEAAFTPAVAASLSPSEARNGSDCLPSIT